LQLKVPTLLLELPWAWIDGISVITIALVEPPVEADKVLSRDLRDKADDAGIAPGSVAESKFTPVCS